MREEERLGNFLIYSLISGVAFVFGFMYTWFTFFLIIFDYFGNKIEKYQAINKTDSSISNQENFTFFKIQQLKFLQFSYIFHCCFPQQSSYADSFFLNSKTFCWLVCWSKTVIFCNFLSNVADFCFFYLNDCLFCRLSAQFLCQFDKKMLHLTDKNLFIILYF